MRGQPTSYTNINDLNDDSNLNELLYKMSCMFDNTDTSLNESNRKRLQPILKTMPKVNTKLRAVFKNLTRLTGQELFSQAKAAHTANTLNFINEKWQNYLNSSHQPMQFITANRSYDNMSHLLKSDNLAGSTIKVKQQVPWENLSAYHRLTFDSGTELLQEKWHQYIGESAHMIGKPSFEFSKKLQKSPSNSMGYASNLSRAPGNTLPLGTQQRLNQHREWLKKFKANSDFKNSSIFF